MLWVCGIHLEGKLRLCGWMEELIAKASNGNVLVAVYEILSGSEDCAITNANALVLMKAVEGADVVIQNPVALGLQNISRIVPTSISGSSRSFAMIAIFDY